MAEPRPSSQASHATPNVHLSWTPTAIHRLPCPQHARQKRTEPSKTSRIPEVLPQTRHDSRWIQVSASSTPHTVRTGPGTGITTTGHTTPRNSRDLDRGFQCVRSTGAKGGGH